VTEKVIAMPGRPMKFEHLHRSAELEARVYARHLEARDWMDAGRKPGPDTGIPKLDKAIGGYMDEGVFILQGVPGAGKTALALQVAVDCQMPVMFVTCEMSPEELFRRIAARVSGVPLSGLRPGGPVSDDSAQGAFRMAARVSSELWFYDSRRDAMTPEALRQALISEKAGIRLVVIDSLHAWSIGLNQRMTEYEALNNTMDVLRSLATEFHVPFLVVAERNRASMASGGMSAVAGTRRVEYGCDCMIELKVIEEEEVKGSPLNTHRTTVNVMARITKNRFGAPGVPIPLQLRLAQQSFEQVQ